MRVFWNGPPEVVDSSHPEKKKMLLLEKSKKLTLRPWKKRWLEDYCDCTYFHFKVFFSKVICWTSAVDKKTLQIVCSGGQLYFFISTQGRRGWSFAWVSLKVGFWCLLFSTMVKPSLGSMDFSLLSKPILSKSKLLKIRSAVSAILFSGPPTAADQKFCSNVWGVARQNDIEKVKDIQDWPARCHLEDHPS